MKYNNFKDSLFFLKEYGFAYVLDSTNNKRECYKNIYGEIILDYKRLDANEYIPIICVEIDNKRTILDIEKDYKLLKGKRFKNFYYKVHTVIKRVLMEEHQIYNLLIESKYIDKIKGIYKYSYQFNKEILLENIKSNNLYKNNTIKIINDNMFFILIKSTHGGGHYYVANIKEKDDKVNIYGSIVHNPDNYGNSITRKLSKNEKIKTIISIIFVVILLFPIFILMALCYLIVWIISLFRKSKEKELTQEEKLDQIMINILCMKKTC